MELKNTDAARRLAKLAFSISGSRLTSRANNVGYLYMAAGDFDEAKMWFDSARQYERNSSQQLLNYNMGVLYAMRGDYREALRYWVEAGEGAPVEAACVYRVMRDEGGGLKFEEVYYPASVSELVTEAVEVVGGMVEEKPRIH